MKKYTVLNVKCGGCANTLKTKLEPIFGEVVVNLEVEPREITINKDDIDESKLRETLISMGYPMADEDLSTLEKIGTTVKSFGSCAIGKMNS
jgi:copper chaperone CopZ